MKKCSKCRKPQIEDNFSKCTKNKDGLRSECKACVSEHYDLTKEKRLQQMKEYNQKNKVKIAEQQKEYAKQNEEKIAKYQKDYQQQNKEKISEYKKEYAKQNKEKVSEYKKEYQKQRYNVDPSFALMRRLRALTHAAFTRVNARKTSKTFDLLGCTGAELLAKWGVDDIPEGFHIDHIVPLAQAQNIEEAEKLCHYNNLRLMEGKENIAKSDSRTEENAMLCEELLGRPWV